MTRDHEFGPQAFSSSRPALGLPNSDFGISGDYTHPQETFNNTEFANYSINLDKPYDLDSLNVDQDQFQNTTPERDTLVNWGIDSYLSWDDPSQIIPGLQQDEETDPMLLGIGGSAAGDIDQFKFATNGPYANTPSGNTATASTEGVDPSQNDATRDIEPARDVEPTPNASPQPSLPCSPIPQASDRASAKPLPLKRKYQDILPRPVSYHDCQRAR